MAYYKYFSTPHVPWSPGATKDDSTLVDMDHFEGEETVETEKRDGECTTLYCDHYHARSIDSNNHPSRNWVKGLWGNIKHDIPAGWRICGENMYAKHSIFYEDLDTYFEVFSIWDENNKCLSWDDTVVWAELLGLKTVPVLHRGKFNLALIKKFHETLDLEKQEGFVIRKVKGFHYDDATENIAKWVRKGHVQTDEHWMHGKIIPNLLKLKK